MYPDSARAARRRSVGHGDRWSWRLFRSRTLLGLSPLYIVLGGFQYLEASLSLRVEVAPGWSIYPASTVMFTATLLAVLLVYIKEETPKRASWSTGWCSPTSA